MTQHDKYICFGCKAILARSELAAQGDSHKGARCPHCAHLLIVNTGPVALASSEIARLFRLQRPSVWSRLPRLPGVTLALSRTPPPLPVSPLRGMSMKAVANENGNRRGRRPPPFRPGPKVASKPSRPPRLKVAPH